MNVSELGEFELLERLLGLIRSQRKTPLQFSSKGFRLLVDAGDDAAVWQNQGGMELITTDSMVEYVHFTRHTISWKDLGWKVLAANVSDVAAMGGTPLCTTITLGLPPETQVDDVIQLYQGMLELANESGASLVGGDVVRSPVLFVTVAITGRVAGTPLLRSAARPGDQIGVSGPLGSSAAGLEMMLKDIAVDGEAAGFLRQAHSRPRPCIKEGQTLVKEGVQAAMDISDGLVDDLSKLCKASDVAAKIKATEVPTHPLLKRAFPERYLEFTLNGGEDYQLVFTGPPAVCQRVLPQLAPTASLVGTIVEGEPGRVEVVSATGEPMKMSRRGWDHFG